MPEFVHVFQSGRMNKDLDERLVPNGEYRDALNLDLANSDGANVGTLQNVKGNIQLRGKGGRNLGWADNYIDSLANPICIGSIRDDKTEKIYWFIASDNVSAIAELNQTTGVISPILVDTKAILKFSKDYLITGINIIDKFLFWTDDQSEPKKINIEKFKVGSTDFTTHTKVPKWVGVSENPATDHNTYEVNLAGQPDFIEEDVTVIKKSPTAAPSIDSSASLFGDNVPGTGITPISTTVPGTGNFKSYANFTYVQDTTNFPLIRIPLDTYSDYLTNIEGNPNYYDGSSIENWDGLVSFTCNTAPQWSVGNIVILKAQFTTEYFTNYNFSCSLKITNVQGATITGKIMALSNDILDSYGSDTVDSLVIYNWEGLLLEEDPMFEYVFPRFAYRWRYIDNEYSCFSPFSEVVFEGAKFKYESADGYNVGMTNNIRRLVIGNLVWPNQEVQEIDILYKESGKNVVYKVDSLNRKDFTTLPSTFEIKTELIGATIEANQILRPWDNVPLQAKSQEIVGNRIVYGNYVQNYDVIDTTSIDLTLEPIDHPSVAEEEKMGFPFPSLKSIRTYQVGVVYIDEYGRETPVFTSDSASLKVPISESIKATKLSVTASNEPPSWAKSFKYFIKETANKYYNLALDRYYLAEDGNVWLSFPSSERNKVDEETFLILKKQHDQNTAVLTENKYKILAIENSPPNFIANFDTTLSSAQGNLQGTSGVGFTSITVRGPSPDANNSFGPNLNGNEVQFFVGSVTTDKYEVDVVNMLTVPGGGSNDNLNDFQITLKRPLGPDAGFINSIADQGTLSVRIIGQKEKNRPEFDGRFFVQIRRDFNFDTNIISSFAASETLYGIKGEALPNQGRTSLTGSAQTDTELKHITYADWGSGYREDDCGRQNVSHQLAGWGTQTGWRIKQTPDASFNQKMANWQPPTQGSKEFGIMIVRPGSQKDIQYIDNMFGHNVGAADNGWTDGSGPPSTPDGFITEGAEIRFKANATITNSDPNQACEEGDYTRVYKIVNAVSATQKRGGRIYHRLDCKSWNNSKNYRYSIKILLDQPIQEGWMPDAGDWNHLNTLNPSLQVVERTNSDGGKLLTSTNPAVFETEPKEAIDLDLYYEASDAIDISQYNSSTTLDWFNCYSYGQGVESNRIRDDFNAPTIDKGAKVSTVLDEPYAKERRGSGLIFSQIYNSTSGVNRLNQFIIAQPITKDLNPTYGTIQKLFARQTDLLSFCEDKVVKILANKDALFNADGSSNVTSNKAVLGQAIVPATFGEYGISKNPESFCNYSYRSYFADKNRGAVLRLSMDGITNIAEKGMVDFFADNLRSSNKMIGSYDEDKDIYNLTLDNLTQEWQNTFSTDQDYQLDPDCDTEYADTSNPATTISFKEGVDGWTGRKSFIAENGISLNNKYYTFKNGTIWEHSLNTLANNFYNRQYDSSFNVLINDQPNSVKGYSTLNYSGTRSRRIEYESGNKWYSIAEINANTLIPTASQEKNPGWYVNFIRTDLESGEVKEFEKKEGKYFNFIKALEIKNDCDFTGEGIGPPDDEEHDPNDYILTLTIDPACSGSGESTPDKVQFFINIWDHVKDSPIYDTNIETETTAQGVKCTIDGFYNLLNQGYQGVLNDGTAFSYVSSEGLQVGTQMYNSVTNQPITSAGAYLFVGTGEYLSALTVDHGGLDPENSSAVPTTYYVMILDSSGKIDSYTQYNTLSNDCSETTGYNGVYFNQGVKLGPPTNSGNSYIYTYDSPENPGIHCDHTYPAGVLYNAGNPLPVYPPITYTGGILYKNTNDDWSVGTQLYSDMSGLTVFYPGVIRLFLANIDPSDSQYGSNGYPIIWNESDNTRGLFGLNHNPQSNPISDNWKIISVSTAGVITGVSNYNAHACF